jgi:hypothetical protein
MKKSSVIALGVCLAGVLGLGIRPAAAQMVDIVTVRLPYATTVGSVTLPAGVYTVRDLKEDGSSPVLEIRSANGVAVSASATHVSAPNSRLAPTTRVVLRHENDKYQFDKIWIEGRDYGYDLHPAAPSQK